MADMGGPKLFGRTVVVSNHLPKDAARLLMRAAMTDPHLPVGESRDRTIAIDKAVDKVKTMYPHHFK